MQGELLLLLAVHLVMTALPGVAASLFLASRGERRIPILLAALLAVSGGVAMLGFWAYYESRAVGQTWTYLVLFGSLLATGGLLYRGGIDRTLLRRLATPLTLWALGSAFLVFLGFLHGGTDQSIATSGTRFSGPLPSDNYMPYFWANWFYAHAHHGTPPEFTGNWLASDRPPLQMGYLLVQQPFHIFEGELNYQVLGVCLQQLWIVGLWALLLALPIGRVTRALAMVTLLVSDLTLVNGFYVWPKLLPAAMLLAAAALVITPLWDEVRGRLWGGVLLAGLCGLAMMGHGSSVYGIVAIVLVAAFRGLPSRRWLGVAVLTLIVVMAPWSAYQKWGDPPGNRLTKWYLGGDVEPDDKSVGEAIREGYDAKLSTILHKKGQNFVAIFGGKAMAKNLRETREAIGRGDFEGAVRPLRSTFFFNLVPSLGLLLLGPVAMAIGWRRRRERPGEWGAAAIVLTTFAVGVVAWALIQYGGSTAQTVVHQGSYLLPALGLLGCTIGLRAVWPRFAIGWLALNAAFMLVVYVPSFEPVEGSSFAPMSALLALLALGAFGFASLWADGGRTTSPARRSLGPHGAPGRRGGLVSGE
jgi:hypothetical protein